MKYRMILSALLIASVVTATTAIGQPRVWLADQGTPGVTTNRIVEIDPFNHNPSGPDGSDVYILNTLPSPALSFLDELTFDDNERLWCVVKDDSDQHPDGARRIDKDTGAIDNPPGLVTINFANEVDGGYLEGFAYDGVGIWVTAVRAGSGGNNMLTRVDPLTGSPIAPFDAGTLGTRGHVDIPGSVCQGLVWEPGNNGYGWLWHSDVFQQKIYKLDVSRLWTDGNYDPTDPAGLTVQEFSVPFKPKGMDWMEDKIWVAAPYGSFWNPASDAGIWEFDPSTGATQKLFSTPQWNLDGLAILDQPPGPEIAVSPEALVPSAWIGSSPANQTFEVSNSHEDTLNYSISYSVDDGLAWITDASPNSGSVTTGSDTITVTYGDTSAFLAGTYTASITVTANAWNSPLTIPVTLTIETVKPDLDGDGDVDQADFGSFQACITGSSTLVTGQCTKADFDGSNTVTSADFSVLANCFSGADVMADPNCD